MELGRQPSPATCCAWAAPTHASHRLDEARQRFAAGRRTSSPEGRRAAVGDYAAARSIFGDAGPDARRSRCPSPTGRARSRSSAFRSSRPGSTSWSWPARGWAKLCSPAPIRTSKSKPVYHVSTAALVTNLAVHFKQGRESSLVWVTALDTRHAGGQGAGLGAGLQRQGALEGLTDARGIARISKELPERRAAARLLHRVRQAIHGVRAQRPAT